MLGVDVDDFIHYLNLVLRQFISSFRFVFTDDISVEGKHACVNDDPHPIQFLHVGIFLSVYWPDGFGLQKAGGRVPEHVLLNAYGT
jgi:hypothetical protein